MANFTTTTSAVFIPEVWSMRTLDATESKLVAAKLVSRFDADVSEKGDIVHIPEVSNFSAARDKSAGTDITLDALTESEKTITIDQHKYVAFAIEDKLAKQSAYDLVGHYTQKAGYQIANAVDTSLLSLWSDLTTTDVGSYEADVSAASLVAAIQTLMVNDVPREDMAFVVDASQAGAMLNVADFVRADYIGNQDEFTRIVTGVDSAYMYGTLYGIPVYYSTNVQKTAGTTTSVHNMLFHKEAFALAMQMAPRVQKQYDIMALADIVVTDVLYGVQTLRSEFGVEIRSTN